MPDAEELKEGKAYYSDTPQRAEGFFLKGSNSLEWGMKDRLARIFNPVSGNTVMLAFDHGYLMGPTSGLERMDLTIVPSCYPRTHGVDPRATQGLLARELALRRAPAGGHGGCW